MITQLARVFQAMKKAWGNVNRLVVSRWLKYAFSRFLLFNFAPIYIKDHNFALIVFPGVDESTTCGIEAHGVLIQNSIPLPGCAFFLDLAL